MIRNAHLAAVLSVGVALGLGAGLAVAPSAASAVGTEQADRAGKQDMLVTLTPQRVERARFASPVSVAQVQIHGDERTVILIDEQGKIVYRSDARAQTTEVSRDAVIPARGPLGERGVEMARIDGAFLRARSTD